MNAKIAEKWVAALRSGEYLQGRGQLAKVVYSTKQPDNAVIKYCCLGILCDLAVKAGLPIDVGHTDVTAYSDGITYDEGTVYLPPIVQRWADIQTMNGRIDNKTSLSKLNDTCKTFPEIADIIEQHVQEL